MNKMCTADEFCQDKTLHQAVGATTRLVETIVFLRQSTKYKGLTNQINFVRCFCIAMAGRCLTGPTIQPGINQVLVEDATWAEID